MNIYTVNSTSDPERGAIAADIRQTRTQQEKAQGHHIRAYGNIDGDLRFRKAQFCGEQYAPKIITDGGVDVGDDHQGECGKNGF